MAVTAGQSAWVYGASEEVYSVNIPIQSVAESLTDLSVQINKQVLFPYTAAKSVEAKPVSGQYRLQQVLDIMLEGTGFSGGLTKKGVLMIELTKSSVTDDKTKGKTEMSNSTKKQILAGIISALTAGGTVAQGTESPESEDWLLEEVVVTATKREQNIQDVPISILAFSGKDLEAQGIGDLQSLSLAVPGLLVAETGSFQRRVSIRGIGNTFGSSSLVGLYVDETSVAVLPANQVDLRIHDLERIEVLKGPQGTLYGEGSVGGTVRYITNDPDLNEFNARLSLDGSTTRHGDTSQGVKGIVNIPLLEDKLGLRLVGQYINSGGWIDQPALSKKDVNDYELSNVRAKLLWLPTDDLEIELSAINHQNNVGAENVGEDESHDYRQAFDDPTTPSSEDDYQMFSLSVSYDFGDVNLVSASGYLKTDKHIKNFGYQCCVSLGTPGDYWNIIITQADVTAEVFTQELRLSANEDGPWYWSTGLFYKDAKSTPLDSWLIAGAPGGTLGVDIFDFGRTYQTEDSKSWAIFGETSYSLSDKLEIGAGLRYFEDERESQTGSESGPIQSGEFDSFNPKLFFKYDFSDNANLYASIAKGFRSGGFNGGGEPSYEPEEVVSYEVGSKMVLLDGRFSADVAVFFSDYQEYQVNAPDLSLGLNITSNSGEAEITGIEWSSQWFATDNLELGFNGNVMDAEFVDVVPGAAYAKGDPLDLVPEYGVGLWGNYTFSWPDSSMGFLRVDYTKQGESHNRNRTFGDDYHSTSDPIDMLAARLGWDNGHFQVEAYAMNLLDEDGFISPMTIERFSPRPRPRTIGLSVAYTFR